MDRLDNQPLSWMHKIVSATSAAQKYYLVNLFFVISLFILGFLILKNLDKETRFLNQKIDGIKYQQLTHEIIQGILKYNLAGQVFKENAELERLALDKQILENFDRLIALDRLLQQRLSTREIELQNRQLPNITPLALKNRWLSSKNDSSSSSVYSFELIKLLLLLLDYTGETSYLLLETNIPDYHLAQQMIIHIPRAELILFEMLNLQYSAQNNQLAPQTQDLTLFLLQFNLFNEFFSKQVALTAFAIYDYPEILNSMKYYVQKMSSFKKNVEALIKQSATNPLQLSDSANLSNQMIDILETSFSLWNEIYERLYQNIQEQLRQFKITQYLGLGIASTFYILGFALGFFFIQIAIESLKDLLRTIKKLTAGNLFARVKVNYQDELGRVGLGFNKMADTFKNLIDQLQEILQAIKNLSRGDFTVRVKTHPSNDEINQVAFSFNHMAENFEQMMNRLQQLGQQLKMSTNQLTITSGEHANAIQKQGKATLEISSASQDIMNTSKSLANNIGEINDVAEHTSTLAQAGKNSLIHMENAMYDMVEVSQYLGGKLNTLNEKVKLITSVITTITEVADQTNLLSLNAAIEAERAGEFGRGFTVIAKEIRRLADQTASATLNIEKMIYEIIDSMLSNVSDVNAFVTQIRSGSEEVAKVKSQLITIIEDVHSLTDRFISVSQATQIQSIGVEHINQAIQELGKTTQYATFSTQQFENIIQQLNREASDLIVKLGEIQQPAPESSYSSCYIEPKSST